MAEDMRQVDAVIQKRLASEVALIDQIANYIISAGGKRIRPLLVLLFAGALGFTGRERFELAAIVEFIHTATLLHDDVVDESALRRGRKTANALFGNAASVLVGDFVYSRAFQMMVSVNRMRVLEVLADATNVIAEGEVLQLMNMHDPDVAVRRLPARHPLQDRQAVRGERAAGRRARRGRRAIEEACAEYGRSLGTAFQLVDDLLDYEGATRAARQERRRRPARRQADAAAPDRDGARHGERAGADSPRDRARRGRAPAPRSWRSFARTGAHRRDARRRARRGREGTRLARRAAESRPTATLC